MKLHFYNRFIAVLLLVWGGHAASQAPSFYHLSTSNGLYDNHVRSLAIDQQGFLWVGTEEGLNRYDGHSVAVFLKQKHPQLPSDNISLLHCDSRNRTWIGTSEGVAWTDNSRKFHRVILPDTVSRFQARAVFSTGVGVIIITANGHFLFDEQNNRFALLDKATSQLPQSNLRSAHRFNDTDAILLADSILVRYNYSSNIIVGRWIIPHATSACPLTGNKIAVGTSTGEILILDANGDNILRKYSLDSIPGNRTLSPEPIELRQAANGDLVIATGLNGLVIINTSGELRHFLHDPSNPASIIANSVYRIVTGVSGEVIAGTSTSGVSMSNTNLKQATFKRVFVDASANQYDNFTGKIVEQGNGIIWIGAYDRLIKWDRNSNRSSFFFNTESKGNAKQSRGIRALCIDRNGILWMSDDRGSLMYFTEKTGFKSFGLDSNLALAFTAKGFPDMFVERSGMIWVSSGKGIFTLDPHQKKAISFDDHPILKKLSGKPVQSTFEDSRNRLWFATPNAGVYCYDRNLNSMVQYTTKQGLPTDVCYMVREDKAGRYFISTSKGLAVVLPGGTIRTFTKSNGLRYDRCESVIIDNDNIAWFSNRNCLVRLDLSNDRMDFFDEKAGLLNDGFRVGSCLETKSGELLWGGYLGISSFFPAQLAKSGFPLQVTVQAAHIRDSVIDLSKTSVLKVPYSDNTVSFEIAGIHLGIPGKTYYRYKLTGFEDQWQTAEDITLVRYTALPPGEYSFRVMASLDGLHWVEAKQVINVHIITPLWKRWWFIAIIITGIAVFIYLVSRNRNKRIRETKEEMEAEQAVNYFASGIHEQQTVDAILWDVARNCIGRLNFEDCVIYLVDDNRNVLIQKAAYGPKSTKNLEVVEPIEIPVGSGITGEVALTGKPEIVPDTTKDSRYIIDDDRRLSEIAVPITWGNKVIAVIDCEHSRRNFFTQRHLSILTTIASLCANKISRAKAEEEKQKAQSILSNTQQKMAEVEMQALRAQMNPHFIFNCLNSINRYIVKSDQATASLYLTRFAKLIRLILDNSGSKNVLLSNELEALKLYIEMESLRFDNKFTSVMHIDPAVNTDSIEVPPLIIQPYVENAIWHGLLHKEGGGRLSIFISMIDEGWDPLESTCRHASLSIL